MFCLEVSPPHTVWPFICKKKDGGVNKFSNNVHISFTFARGRLRLLSLPLSNNDNLFPPREEGEIMFYLYFFSVIFWIQKQCVKSFDVADGKTSFVRHVLFCYS